jgi:hypothetical protein
MQKFLLFCLLLFALPCVAQTTSPSVMNMGGGSKKIAPDFILDWNIGESTVTETYYLTNPVYNSYVGKYWNVTSGVLQPFDNVYIVFNPNVPAWSIYEIHFYPVPAIDYITIDFKSTISGKITIQLLNKSGTLLEEKEFNAADNNNKVTWSLLQRLPSIYFFRIFLTSPQGKILKQGTFEIEKIK